MNPAVNAKVLSVNVVINDCRSRNDTPRGWRATPWLQAGGAPLASSSAAAAVPTTTTTGTTVVVVDNKHTTTHDDKPLCSTDDVEAATGSE